MAMFNSYVSHYQRAILHHRILEPIFRHQASGWKLRPVRKVARFFCDADRMAMCFLLSLFSICYVLLYGVLWLYLFFGLVYGFTMFYILLFLVLQFYSVFHLINGCPP